MNTQVYTVYEAAREAGCKYGRNGDRRVSH